MALDKLPVPGRPTIWMIVGQGPRVLAVGASGGCLDIFILIYPVSPQSPSFWETARYRLKYCLERPLYPKQPTKILILNFCGNVFARNVFGRNVIDPNLILKAPITTAADDIHKYFSLCFRENKTWCFM